jgi:hypothetical protein
MATTAIAFQVLEKEETYKGLLNNIIQFFLERRSSGRMAQYSGISSYFRNYFANNP